MDERPGLDRLMTDQAVAITSMDAPIDRPRSLPDPAIRLAALRAPSCRRCFVDTVTTCTVRQASSAGVTIRRAYVECRVRSAGHAPPMPPRESRVNRGNRAADEAIRRLGMELRQARLAAGLSQPSLARTARMSPSKVSRVERGISRAVSIAA
jgi:Helix-turn-helix domain